MSFQPVRPP